MVGNFITFEGGEGSGKSTQLKLLSEYLNKKGIQTVATKEPGGTKVGIEIRRLLVVGDKDKFDYIAETLLYSADRRIHLQDVIIPSMAEDKWVLSDRFADSTTAYQYYGHGKKISLEDLSAIYKLIAGDFKPNLTILFDIDPKVGLSRSYNKADTMSEKETRFESIGLEFHNRLREGFLEIAKKETDRFVVLDANKSIEELHIDVIKVIEERFSI